MKFRQLPRTDLVLSEVGFGVWTVATNWWGKLEDAERAALLENAVELGINFFDTADTYGDGFGERSWPRCWATNGTTWSSPQSSDTTSTTRHRGTGTGSVRRSLTRSS